MNFWFLFLISGAAVVLGIELNHNSIILFIIACAMFSLLTLSYNFIQLVLILEMFMLSAIYILSFYSNSGASPSMLMVLFSLSVGEAVMGLSLLAGGARYSSSFMFHSLMI